MLLVMLLVCLAHASIDSKLPLLVSRVIGGRQPKFLDVFTDKAAKSLVDETYAGLPDALAQLARMCIYPQLVWRTLGFLSGEFGVTVERLGNSKMTTKSKVAEFKAARKIMKDMHVEMATKLTAHFREITELAGKDDSEWHSCAAEHSSKLSAVIAALTHLSAESLVRQGKRVQFGEAFDAFIAVQALVGKQIDRIAETPVIEVLYHMNDSIQLLITAHNRISKVLLETISFRGALSELRVHSVDVMRVILHRLTRTLGVFKLVNDDEAWKRYCSAYARFLKFWESAADNPDISQKQLSPLVLRMTRLFAVFAERFV